MKRTFGIALWTLLSGCAVLQQKTFDEPSPAARILLNEGQFVEATLMRRFADGNLLVRLTDDSVYLLGPKQTCSWCWMYVSRRVYVELAERSAVLLSPKGERMECWNGGLTEAY